MSTDVQALMLEATRLTRAGQLHAATQALQRALALQGGQVVSPSPSPATMPAAGEILDGFVREVGVPTSAPTAAPAPAADAGERFVAGHHAQGALARDYKLFVPAGQAPAARPLVVMLHGCTQDADDFALGTGMNRLARQHGLCVLYPVQSAKANPSRCWNWFKHSHQARGRGEAAWIAALTQAVTAEHGLDPQRVYIAGLSAGGAMAAAVAAAYPELYAAVGVHSGLAAGAAQDLPAALAAMKGPAPGRPAAPLARPLIVFHGDADATVHPCNGQSLVAAAQRGAPARVETGVSAAGRRYTRSVWSAEAGIGAAEHWQLHGAGHAWSGGQRRGSYTDPQGPDASGEMLRFFLAQPARGAT